MYPPLRQRVVAASTFAALVIVAEHLGARELALQPRTDRPGPESREIAP